MQSRHSFPGQLTVRFSTGMQLGSIIALTCKFARFLVVNRPCGGYRKTILGKSFMHALRVYLRLPSDGSAVSVMG